MTVNRSDLEKLMKQKGIPEPKKTLDVVLETISGMLALEETVKLRNFGIFEPRHHQAVVRSNPQTGDKIEVPEKMTVAFRPADALKARLNR